MSHCLHGQVAGGLYSHSDRSSYLGDDNPNDGWSSRLVHELNICTNVAVLQDSKSLKSVEINVGLLNIESKFRDLKFSLGAFKN